MAKTTVLIDINIGAQVPPTTAWMIWATPFMFDTGNTVVLPVGEPVKLVAGVGQVSVDAGVWMVTAAGPGFTKTQAWMVPASDIPVQFSALIEVTDEGLLGFGPTWAARAELAALNIITQVESAAGYADEALAYRNQAQQIADALATTTDEQIASRVMDEDSSTREALELWGTGTFLSAASAANDFVKRSRKVKVLIVFGQSNPEGRGTEYGPLTDPVNPQIHVYRTRGGSAGTITVATEPLDSSIGQGPALQFARRYVAKYATPDESFLIVTGARGNTALSTDSLNGWRRGVAGNLYSNLLGYISSAITALGSDAEVEIVAAIYQQGETDGDNNVPGAQYQTDFDALLNGLRTDLGLPDLPIVIGTMVPEYLTTGTRIAINAVHRSAPLRIAKTDVAVSAVNMNKGDGNHFSSAGQRFNAGQMFAAYERIRAGLAPYSEGAPAELGPVLGLTAPAGAHAYAQPLTWTALAGATSYLVEFKETGGTEWVVAGTTATNSFTVGGLFGSKNYSYRVSPIGSAGTGYASAVVTAATIAEVAVVTDSFNRADNAAALGNADTGQAWAAISAIWAVASNQAYHGSTANALAEVESGIADGIARVTVATLGATATALDRLVIRGDGTASNYWMLQYRQSTNRYQIYKNVAGTFTQMGLDLPVIPAAGDVLEASFVGSIISWRINGVVLARTDDAALATLTHHGLGGTGNTGRYDNFMVRS
jgi:hypothetical protein